MLYQTKKDLENARDLFLIMQMAKQILKDIEK